MIKYLFLFIIFILPSQLVEAQIFECSDTIKKHQVIATSGLVLRTEPDRNSSKIINIPKNDIALVCTYCGDKCKTEIIEGIESKWVKVYYKNLEGYAFKGFLKELPAHQNINFSLVNYFVSDWKDNYFNKNSIFYGLFADKKDSMFFIYKKIEMKDTIRLDVRFDDHPIHIKKAVSHEKPLVLFTNFELPDHTKIRGKAIDRSLLLGDTIDYQLDDKNYIITTTGIFSKDKKRITDHILKIIRNVNGKIDEKAYLNLTLNEWTRPNTYEGGIRIYWIGDLDGDKHLDMILSYTENYKCSTVVLLLSRQAEAGHFFKETSRYYLPAC